MKPQQTDIAIIGAGPAGTAAAIEIGRAGGSSVLFERGKPGKDKACGDAVLPGAIAELEALGFCPTDFVRWGGRPFSTIDLFDTNKKIWCHHLPAKNGWMIPRACLDQQLRDLAGRHCTLEYESKVLDIKKTATGLWEISYLKKGIENSLYASVVILATGANNGLAKRFGISGMPLSSFSLSTYLTKSIPEEIIFQFQENIPGGYGWLFKVSKNEVNLGVCSLLPGDQLIRQKAEQYLYKHAGSQSGNWRGGAGPLWSGKGEKWHVPSGVLSCGDAAGLIDPINGEGIAAALGSGKKAGKAALDFLRRSRQTDELNDYSAYIQHHFSGLYADNWERTVWKNISLLP